MNVSYNYYIYVDLDVQKGIKETVIVYYTASYFWPYDEY